MLVLVGAQEQEWDELHMAVKQFSERESGDQVREKAGGCRAAGYGTGGGCEISLHRCKNSLRCGGLRWSGGNRSGLIPGGGGTKEMLIRANEHAAGGEDLDLFHALKPVFEKVAMAKSRNQRGGVPRDRIFSARGSLLDEHTAIGCGCERNCAGTGAIGMESRWRRAGRKARRARRSKRWANNFFPGETGNSHVTARRICFGIRCNRRA